jgi:predicted RNA-binding protein YlqC (UPF0109 family)
MNDNQILETLVALVVKQLVDHPEQVEIRSVGDRSLVILGLRLNPADISKVIGKSGHTIMALRVLVSNIASKHGQHALLEVIEPDSYRHPTTPAGFSEAPHRTTASSYAVRSVYR